VIDYLESATEKTHLHVDARHLLVVHLGPVFWMWMVQAVCGTTAHVVHAMWMYVGPLLILCMLCGCMWDHCTCCACCVDVCGTTALVVRAIWMYVRPLHMWYMLVDVCVNIALVHAMWMYVGPLHMLYMLCGCLWDHCICCIWYVEPLHMLYMLVDACGTMAHVVHAMWMYVGPLNMLYMLCGAMWDHCTCCTCTCMWMYVGPLHILYVLYGCTWDHCTCCTCYTDVCGTTAHVVHAIRMYVGPLHMLYIMWECTGESIS
jgi:hypothetical protein